MNQYNITNVSSYHNDTGYPDDSSGGPEQWGFWVKFVSTPIIVVVGVIGNTLSLIVMKSKTLRNKSYSHYLCALAVFDTTTLLTRLIKTVDEYYVDHNHMQGIFQDFNNVTCKLYTFLEPVVYLMSSWLVVLMAIERLIAVCFPFKKVVIRQQSGAAIAIVCLMVLVCLSQVFRIVMNEHIVYEESRNIWICSPAYGYMDLYTSLDIYFYQLTLAFILPVSIVLGCNCLVLYQIFKVKREMKQNDKNTRHNRVVRQKHRTTCMLLTVSFTYIATLLPLFTLTTIIDVAIKVNKETAFFVYMSLLPFLDVCVAISLLNYAVNFFIYILSGKRFRFEFRKVFRREPKARRSFTARSTREEFIRL